MNLSIITPSFNQGIFIERTIKSVLMQSISHFEYVVMDGGSTDETITILKKYDSKLRWMSEKDNGQTQAINKALKLVSGDIIGWVNSDDIYYPNAFKTVMDYFQAHPEIDVVYGNANYIDANDEIIEPYPTQSWNKDKLIEACYLCQPAVFFRRRVIDKFGFLNEKLNYCMDYEYWLRLALNGAQFFYSDQILAGSRLHPDTKSLGAKIPFYKEINQMLKMKLGAVPNRWLLNYAHIVVDVKKDSYSPFLIKNRIAIHAILASLRWNHWINKSLLSSLESLVNKK